jgi:hypothetical protein
VEKHFGHQTLARLLGVMDVSVLAFPLLRVRLGLKPGGARAMGMYGPNAGFKRKKRTCKNVVRRCSSMGKAPI